MDPKSYKFCNVCEDPNCIEFGNCRKGSPEENEVDKLEQEFEENFELDEDEDREPEEDNQKDFTIDDARNKIRIVFKYYASYGDRLNMSYIQASKVVKMMKESGIIDKGGVSKKDVDILFAKVNKSKPNMYFEDFVKLLYEISQVKYSIDPTEAFRALLHDHIFPQCNAIIGVKHKTREIKENKLVTKIFNSILSNTNRK